MAKRIAKPKELVCDTWDDVVEALHESSGLLETDDGETVWYRGLRENDYDLLPTLMRETKHLRDEDHDQIEKDLFFEFQARASDLRAKNLSDWEYLFFGRHYGVPTRVMDWSDTFGVALYFAMEELAATETGRPEGDHRKHPREPSIYVLRPSALNEETWDLDDIELPKYLGLDDDGEFWEFGELLAGNGDWEWDGPVAIYPIQINERVRAQRGWFTIHGNDRSALDVQHPELLTKIRMRRGAFAGAQHFLRLAGLNRFSMYPDLENLAAWISEKNRRWAKARAGRPDRR